MSRASAPSTRATRAVESFQTAAKAIGDISPGMSLFAVTRGQWSMLDAILHCLDCVGPAEVSLWTWTVASYEIDVLTRMRDDGRITNGRLVIDYAAERKNADVIDGWRHRFGPASVRYVVNHAKIATVTTPEFRLLLRGSMNLNFNPRFEQFDLSEGGPAYNLVRDIENELPVIPARGADAYKASKVSDAFAPETLALFSGVKTWAK